MILTVDLPENLAERLTEKYPDEAARDQWVICSLLETLDWEQQETEEVIAIVNVELEAIEAGTSKSYTMEEAWQMLHDMEAERFGTAKS